MTVGCGNGILESGEECDDGNLTNYDGCSSTCKLEETQRVDYLDMQFATDSNCAKNALGAAISESLAQNELQTQLTDAVKSGQISILLQFLGAITDPSGANGQTVTVGVMSAAPDEPAGSPTYNGASDLDWWYLPDSNDLSDAGEPLARLSASFSTAGNVTTLSAGPGNILLNISFGAGLSSFDFSHATFRSSVGPRTAPIESSSGLPPGHLAAENVSPSVTTIQSLGAATSTGAGTLCGNVSAGSLAASDLPSSVTSFCTTFTSSNTLLDLVVNGCTAFTVAIVTPTQPDTSDPSMPAAGAGAPYTFSASSGVTVDTCADKNGATVDFNTCLAAAAYSTYFKFATDRVISRE